MLEADLEIDVGLLKSEIRKTYACVSSEPETEFVFPTGRAWAEDLGYPKELDRVPESAAESFAGVANPFSLGRLRPGERVLDLGSGAGMDSLVAAQMVGPGGRVTGIDMTPEMVAKARGAAAALGVEHVEFMVGEAERLPFADASFDVVISNGVVDLIPDKDAVFGELHRVLEPGGRLQIADVTIQNPVSAEGRRNIDLWTGWIAGALLEAAYARFLERHGFERIETGQLVDTYARSTFEDTRRKAKKYGAYGTTLKAYRPVEAVWHAFSIPRAPTSPRSAASLRRLADFGGQRVLEMGCGDGRLTAGLAEDAAYVLAFDPDADRVAEARRTLAADLADRVSFRVASGKEIEVEPHSFDVVVFSWSLWCVDPEDVVDVLGRMVGAVRPGGAVLDLQVIRPDPVIEAGGRGVGEIDGESLFGWADAAVAAVDALVRDGRLVDEATDDHDVLEHFVDGRRLVSGFAGRKRRLPEHALPELHALDAPCVVRERCRLRRLTVRLPT